MLLKFWNYIRGYLIIKVSGFSVERFLNLVVYKNIYIWDLKYTESGIIMKVSLKNFKLLKPYAKKTGCKIFILKKIGRPFIFFKYRKRKLLFIGSAFFIFILYFLSFFIWNIEIEGNKKIDSRQLVSFIKEKGVKVGSFKYFIKKKYLEKEIISCFKNISFINIDIKGTKIKITIKEILPKKNILNVTKPTNIVASKDCIISNIFISRGTPLVKIGDVVSKGDILVTGEITAKENDINIIQKYVNSVAEVRGKVYYNINFNLPKQYMEKRYTGKVKKKIKFNINNKYINTFSKNIKFLNYDKNISMKQISIGENYPLPFIIIKETYREFLPIKKEYTLEEMKDVAEEIITNRIITEFNIDTDIINKKIKYTENKDYLEVKSIITTIENIADTVLIE